MFGNIEIKTAKFNSAKNKIDYIELADGEILSSGANVENVASVQVNVPAGEIASGTSIALSCPTDEAVIFYTKNGDDPSMTSTLYTKAIKITADTTIKAVAYKDGCLAAEPVEFAYTISD